ncbi:flavodoxin family protein [Desulfolucanica intricata]|uniref:flavodoxin family protein n=1 Tax=Desulfolucanica intricata TaxID=1285191 RepID=UPI00082AF5BF|nr:flavodoxin family protein [Desulfolucanica intricata]
MLILALNGSPSRNGNTAELLKVALEAAGASGVETAFLQVSEAVNELKNPFCVNCSPVCEGKCFKDTKLAAMYDMLRRADGVLVGSPVYFGTVSAQLKAFWDKGRSLRKDKALLNVVGGALAVGGSRYGGQENTLRAIMDIMLVQGMTLVGDGFIENDAGHHGVSAQRPSVEDSDALKRARILGRRVLEVARATIDLRAHRQNK